MGDAQQSRRETARLEARRRRRRKRRYLAAGVAIGLAAATFGAFVGRGHHTPRASAPTKTAAHAGPPKLAPPGPIPGYLLIADRGNNRMLLVDSAKHVYWRYPRPGSNLPMPFRFGDDTFFGPRIDRIVSNQEEQHTIQIVSFPGGHVLWRYGHVDMKGSAHGFLNTPDDAYLLPNGTVTVADAYNCRVQFISPAHRIVKQYGSGVCAHNPPSQLGSVNGATPLPDGGTLVSEINGSWIDDFGPTGRLRWSVAAPVSYPSDPQLLAPNRILLADYARPGHALIMTRSGRVLWRYGPATGPGALDHPSLATRIAPGLIAINDDYRHRVVIVSMRTKRIVWQYGHTDVAGSGPGYLNTPDGMDLLHASAASRVPVLRRLLQPTKAPPPKKPANGLVALHVRAARYRLPAPVEREVAVASAGSIVIAGGLDASNQSTNGVFRMDRVSGRLTSLGTVPEPFHDATGALIGHRLFVFGGGAAQSSSSVQAFDLRTHKGSVAARLPRAISDLSSATAGGVVYLVGGYDGTRPRSEIYRTTDGLHFALAGRLPVGVRYPAVTAVGSTIVVAGGVTPSGTTSAVYAFDTTSGRARLLGRMQGPVAHATALALGGFAYVLGGTGSGAAMSRVDVRRGIVTASRGTIPVSDAPGVLVGKVGMVIGGDRSGRPVRDVTEVRGP